MSPLMELQPSERCPALQYLDDVDQGGVADMAGLRKGDYLLAVSWNFMKLVSIWYVIHWSQCDSLSCIRPVRTY
jgi:SH3/ankyrin repeat-containing protein